MADRGVFSARRMCPGIDRELAARIDRVYRSAHKFGKRRYNGNGGGRTARRWRGESVVNAVFSAIFGKCDKRTLKVKGRKTALQCDYINHAAKVVGEADGSQHYVVEKHFHSKSKPTGEAGAQRGFETPEAAALRDQKDRDAKKRAEAQRREYMFVAVPIFDVKVNKKTGRVTTPTLPGPQLARLACVHICEALRERVQQKLAEDKRRRALYLQATRGVEFSVQRPEVWEHGRRMDQGVRGAPLP